MLGNDLTITTTVGKGRFEGQICHFRLPVKNEQMNGLGEFHFLALDSDGKTFICQPYGESDLLYLGSGRPRVIQRENIMVLGLVEWLLDVNDPDLRNHPIPVPIDSCNNAGRIEPNEGP